MANDDAPAPSAATATQLQDIGASLEAALEVWDRVGRSLSEGRPVEGKVPWLKDAVDSLENARRYAGVSVEARAFIDNWMGTIVETLLQHEPAKLGRLEHDCVEKSLRCSLQIVAGDLRALEDSEPNSVCRSIYALGHIFNSKQTYYTGDQEGYPMAGGCKARTQMITAFYRVYGFKHLAAYLRVRTSTPQFPAIELAKTLLRATRDLVPDPAGRHGTEQSQSQSQKIECIRDEARQLVQLTMEHLSMLDSTALGKMDQEDLSVAIRLLLRLRIKLQDSPHVLPFFSFWRGLILTMIRSQCPRAKLFGWEQISKIIQESEKMRPPPRAYVVEGAGTDFINGRYELSSDMITELGYAISLPRNDLHCWQYHRQVPNDGADSDEAGKTITLFRCIMRSKQKWWFLSEPDKDQPGTDKDVDYYQHKSKKNEEAMPSLSGWVTCRAGQDPAPTLKPVGLMVPPGEEETTPEHQLAKWTIENSVVELALGDSTNGEIVSKATALVQFLARMCNDSVAGPQKYCLQVSHLFVASQSIERTTDAMTLAHMHLLLLTICESLPEHLREMIPPISQSATLRRIQLNDPTLLALQVGGNFGLLPNEGQVGVYDPIDGSDFERLGHSIAANEHLEIVQFDSTIRFEGIHSAMTDAFCKGLKQNSSIQSLQLCGSGISQAEGGDILTAFRERNAKLSERISLFNCDMGTEGSRILSSTLRACASIRDISLPRNGIEDDDLVDIIAAIRDHSQLETICLSDNNIERVDPLVDLLDSAQCDLVTVELGNNRINSAGAIMLARALAKNRKLVKLNLASNSRIVWNAEVLEAFSKSICDTSSVNATYLSNHTVESIGFEDDDWEVEELDLLLQLNALADKDRVAMRKILRLHSQIDMMPFFEWDLKALPSMIRWFDAAMRLSDDDEDEDASDDEEEEAANVDARKLDAIYQFTLAMPLMVVPALRECSFDDGYNSDSSAESNGKGESLIGSNPSCDKRLEPRAKGRNDAGIEMILLSE